jgi:extradiol dioxygenase family protein
MRSLFHLAFNVSGEPGEQWTMFFLDPFGNPLEIKGFQSLDGLYAT